jgi:hypothetical protein
MNISLNGLLYRVCLIQKQEFCMDVYHPSGFGRRKRRSIGGAAVVMSSNNPLQSNATAMEYSAPLSQHWRTIEDDIILDNEPAEHRGFEIDLNEERVNETDRKTNVDIGGLELVKHYNFHIPVPPETVVSSGFTQSNIHKENIDSTVHKYLTKLPSTTPIVTPSSTTASTTNVPKAMKKPKHQSKSQSHSDGNDAASTNFGDNIGFSVIMPSGLKL